MHVPPPSILIMQVIHIPLTCCTCSHALTLPHPHYHSNSAELFLHSSQVHGLTFYNSTRIKAITEGFRIGFQYTSPTLLSAKSNHPSALDHPDIVSKSLEAEQEKCRLIGPISPSRYPHLHVSSLGVIPKKHSSKWRLIVDLMVMMVLIAHVVPFRI